MRKWDVFVCHASEDKSTFVEPLADCLRELSVRVWFDKHILRPGDRLSEKIATGLAQCRSGCLVLSQSFIGKPWTRYEMSGLVNRFVEEDMRLIPVWLDVSRAEVAALNPALADLYAISADPSQMEDTAIEILKTIRPQLYENLTLLSQIDTAPSRSSRAPRTDIVESSIRHHDLSEALRVRIQNIWIQLQPDLGTSLADWIEGFQRELRPEREVSIWERIASAHWCALTKFESIGDDARSELLGVLVSLFSGGSESVLDKAQDGKLQEPLVRAAIDAWLHHVPELTITDVEEGGK
ncbi:hypothetical protein CKO51_08675 [Rhodopirellula sp. SM50]|nr:toll/interleukin-1 receptor domain-containing protein [Rhodopirellula sp. SM50]PAY19899.1 hypothetical protein CKO51_08675 [Rhodopirellula sp. SM50]